MEFRMLTWLNIVLSMTMVFGARKRKCAVVKQWVQCGTDPKFYLKRLATFFTRFYPGLTSDFGWDCEGYRKFEYMSFLVVTNYGSIKERVSQGCGQQHMLSNETNWNLTVKFLFQHFALSLHFYFSHNIGRSRSEFRHRTLTVRTSLLLFFHCNSFPELLMCESFHNQYIIFFQQKRRGSFLSHDKFTVKSLQVFTRWTNMCTYPC